MDIKLTESRKMFEVIDKYIFCKFCKFKLVRTTLELFSCTIKF